LLREQAAEQGRANDLRGLLASLNEQEGRRQLRCPLPQSQPPAPPRHADLPADRWGHDISMLDGCWHKYTSMQTTEIGTGKKRSVREWTLCFDRSGHGKQTIIWDDDARCENELSARFNGGDRLGLSDKRNCAGTRSLVLTDSNCQRISDSEAVCDMKNREGPYSSQPPVQGKFRR
jgi:hypothetical protein